MKGKCVFFFMWKCQGRYRENVEFLAERVFNKLAIPTKPKVLIIGIRQPKSNQENLVCIEPEDDEWSINLFTGLFNTVEEIFKNHPYHNMTRRDKRRTHENPEWIRRNSVKQAVEQVLQSYDAEHQICSFCGVPYPIDDYYVVAVIQVPEEVFKLYPSLQKEIQKRNGDGHSSFIHAVISELLRYSTDELKRPNPYGKSHFHLRPEEFIHRAARSFLKTTGIAIHSSHYSDMFEKLNIVSSLMYEGTKGNGRLLLVNSKNPAIEYALRLVEPVPFREPRHARKILQMASQDIMLIADCEKIHGLGKLNENHDATQQDAFIVDFLDHYHWQLRCGKHVLIQSKYGEPTLPQEEISRDRFMDNYSRLFPQTSSEQQNHIWQLFNCAIEQNYGSMLVIATDAADEANRLARQGTPTQPILMTTELFQRVSGIDGTIILDPSGICHAIGIILDGKANEQCTPSRGSRFNSGVRYVEADKKQRLAIVVSDDKTVDIFPLLEPRIEKAKIIQAIAQLEQATADNYHKPRNWLDEHRFYLDAEQCERINAELHRIDDLPREDFEIRYMGNGFEPYPDMDESYFLPTIF